MRRAAALLTLALAVGACSGDAPQDFGPGQPEADAPALPSDDGLRIADAPAPQLPVPAPDTVLEDGGWPETAAWIARENEAGRPVLVNILASWCIPCKRELPVLLAAADANPDVTFLGIDHLDRREDAEAFLEEQQVTFPVIYDDTGDVATAVGSRVMPTTVVFDAEGRLTGRIFGEVSADSLDQLLDTAR